MTSLKDIPCYAIALDERREQITEELGTQAMKPTVISAIDMRQKDLPDNWTRQKSDYGCTLSWLRALRQAYDDQHEYMAFFEDDFVFRHDTLKYIPDLEYLESLPLDALYLTGHYAKGATRIEPRRINSIPGIVKAFGIHTTPARILRRSYIPILCERLEHNVKNYGFGVDTTDASLQVERKKTFALEAHVGGQRSGDARSWEPRYYDSDIAVMCQSLDSYPTYGSEGSVEEARALTTILSREQFVVAVGCSIRTLCLLSEAATRIGGLVTAFNPARDVATMEGRLDDRIKRYQGYGTLQLNVLEDGHNLQSLDALCLEFKPNEDKSQVLDFIAGLPSQGDGSFPAVFTCGNDEDAKSSIRRILPFRRSHRSAGTVFFANVMRGPNFGRTTDGD